MTRIDWSKAPEWAVEHGLATDGYGIAEFWIGETQHKNLRLGKAFPHGGGDPSCDSFHNLRRNSFEHVTKRPAPWNGEGLPPVGTVCEFAGGTPCPEDPFDKDLKEGMPVTIIAHIKGGDFTLAAFTFDPKNPDRGMVQVEMGNFGCFRPIRTPEQIAAAERADEVTRMMALNPDENPNRMLSRRLCEALYDAGYRKQVAP